MIATLLVRYLAVMEMIEFIGVLFPCCQGKKVPNQNREQGLSYI